MTIDPLFSAIWYFLLGSNKIGGLKLTVICDPKLNIVLTHEDGSHHPLEAIVNQSATPLVVGSCNLQLENGIYDINVLNIAFQNLTSYLHPTNGWFSTEPLTSLSQVCIIFYVYVNTELSF